ncbi:DUF3667 domain-containing protein [Cognatilysobacter lacus]|uniref:DUF3667 domain-containing protein n=1 Tax=Cognatilysobacter lacus TaxID=1643323 RepID=A0A5D8YHV5_9GAMM|nr:DUF3667 domain-containing protein [Lysobacter lacus]TZF82348.1 DUF3667 domain-containing protein [Lysobacter lacus]
MHAAEIPATCENCGTMLQGEFCHACGQGAHNPLHDVRHALEEVFESFWHLDGRAFRTLRDLLVPGRVACNYLAGQRARYIPPLRLFLVLTVLTFFVGQFIAGDIDDARTGNAPIQINLHNEGGQATSFSEARTDAEVQATLERELASVAKARRQTAGVPLAGAAMDDAEKQLREQARVRRAQLGVRTVAAPVPAAAKPASASIATRSPSTPVGPQTRLGKTGAEVADTVIRKIGRAHLRDPKHPWEPTSNPVRIDGLPALGDHWVNHRIANVADNIDRMTKGGKSVFFELMLAAVPSALFVLVPVFALLLRVFYLFSGRSYLEHLVIALYSHAFLLLTLFATFVLMMLPLPKAVSGWVIGLAWIWAAVYVLLMQRRVYRQHWFLTTVKYFAIGFLYQFLLFGGLLYAVFAGLSSGH